MHEVGQRGFPVFGIRPETAQQDCRAQRQGHRARRGKVGSRERSQDGCIQGLRCQHVHGNDRCNICRILIRHAIQDSEGEGRTRMNPGVQAMQGID